jgi:hypothetical protein
MGDLFYDIAAGTLCSKVIFERHLLASSNAVFLARNVAPRTFPPDYCDEVLDEALRASPILGVNVAISQPIPLLFSPLSCVLVLS